MTKVLSAKAIKDRQIKWSHLVSCTVDSRGYCSSPEANLPWLSDRTRREFDQADGNEFGREGSRGKILALHSSSALAVNVFDYWRGKDLDAIGRALGSAKHVTDLRFERKFPTGVGPKAPNVDVAVQFSDDSILAIESKFTETFGLSKKTIKETYFEGRRWADKGLSGAQAAAEEVREGASFGTVDAPQLLKHMLGLASQSQPWSLLLLWYAPDQEVALQMAEDAKRFKSALATDGHRFEVMTYQELWPHIHRECGENHREYAAYIGSRYFVD
jgi:hypothetical protein